MKSKISYKAFWAFVSWSDSVTRQLRNCLFWHQKHPKFTGENHHLFEPKKRKSNSVKSGHSVAFRKNPGILSKKPNMNNNSYKSLHNTFWCHWSKDFQKKPDIGFYHLWNIVTNFRNLTVLGRFKNILLWISNNTDVLSKWICFEILIFSVAEKQSIFHAKWRDLIGQKIWLIFSFSQQLLSSWLLFLQLPTT